MMVGWTEALPVPFQSFRESLLQRVRRLVSQQARRLGYVRLRMADISRPEVLIDRANVPQVRIPGQELLTQTRIELIEGGSGADSNIIDLVHRLCPFHRRREEIGLDDIGHVTKVTAGFTIAIDKDGLVSQHRGDPFGDYCGVGAVGVLAGAEDVKVPQPHRIQSVTPGKDVRIKLVRAFGYGIR